MKLKIDIKADNKKSTEVKISENSFLSDYFCTRHSPLKLYQISDRITKETVIASDC